MDVAGFIRKSAEKIGFKRGVFNEDNIPTDPSRVTVVPFFGDVRSLYVLSSLLLNRVKIEDKSSRYLIICSWPGFDSLFTYVDEYWSLSDEDNISRIYSNARGFRNDSEEAISYYRLINQHFFEDVLIPYEYFNNIYSYGIMDGFWKKYKKVVRTLPDVPSSVALGKDFIRDLNSRGGYKIFIYPSMYINNFSLNDISLFRFPKDFWLTLVRELINNKYIPVIYKGLLTHDLSSDLGNECVYFRDNDFSKVMSAMRATGCVLDVFNGISRVSLAARCPFLAVDDRLRYAALKEYEIDDLCGPFLPKQYLFSFPTIITDGDPKKWGLNLIAGILAKLYKFLPTLDRDTWPSTGSSTEYVSYDSVREKKIKRIGTRLLKVPKD